MIEEMLCRNDFIVITGGPGAGKTTLLEEIRKGGFKYIPEVARKIIQAQVSSSGNALPWGNATKYRDIMLDESVEDYLSECNRPSEKALFFDRGIPDTLAYSRLITLPVFKKLEEAARKYRYNHQVFILPPWKEIYITDHERKQNFEEAVSTHKVLRETYEQLDYELIEVPKVRDRKSVV